MPAGVGYGAMFSKLLGELGIGGQPPAPSGEQVLQQARTAQAMNSTAELEAQARAAGFPSYGAMRAYMIQRGLPNQNPARGRNSQAEMGVDTAMAWHPSNTLNRASEAMRSVRER